MHLAASQNQIHAVKFLVENGADITIVDVRGNNAVADATRMNLLDISMYLNSVMSESIIKQYCSKFSNGILSKGILSAIGTFRNRFEDMQIKISTSKDTNEMRTLLAGTRFGSNTGRFANITILRTYYQC